MRILLIILFFPIICFAQNKSKGYGYLGATSFLSDKFDNRVGVAIGFGISPDKHASLGAGFDVFLFSKTLKFVQAYGDFRLFFAGLDKKASPFIAVQPGAVLCNTDILGVKTRGSFAINALLGLIARPQGKGPGIYFAGGYSNISFLLNKVKTNYGGIKICGGLSF
jgi:hypothetical protein